MGLNLRSKLLLALLSLSLVPLGAASLFFLKFIHDERIDFLLAREADAVDRSRVRLDNVLRLAEAVDLARIDNVPELLWVGEDPCNPAAGELKVGSSPEFAGLTSHLGVDYHVFAQDLDVFEACKGLPAGSAQIRILPARVPLMVPYLRVLARRDNVSRLALISMESLGTSPDSTLLLADRSGSIVWAADGDNYLSTALLDTGTTPAQLASVLKEESGAEHASSTWIGSSGLISGGKVGADWVLASLSYSPTLLAPVSFARTQMLLLAAGFLLLAVLVGRRLAISISSPFAGLKDAADRVGGGDLTGRFEVHGGDEVAAVHKAFNQMSSRIETLLTEKAKQAELQSELKVATEVQRMLLPSTQLNLARHRVESHVRFAAACGGDFWAALDLGGSCLVIVADATGHGVPPALVTGVMRGAVSMLSEWIARQPEIASDVAELLNRLNRIVYDSAQGLIMMSAFLAHLDPVQGQASFCNAGHCFPYLISPAEPGASAAVRALQVEGKLLGAERELAYGPTQVRQAPWKPGSRLFLYSDGLVDFPDKDGKSLFDRRRLVKTLRAHAHVRGSLLRTLMGEHEKAVRGAAQPDDVTAVIVEAL
jgi:serine phosphatase RsbU (regulator of sigma subunit)